MSVSAVDSPQNKSPHPANQLADTQEQKKAFDGDREAYHRYKKMIENELNKRFKLVLRNTQESDEANAVSKSQAPNVFSGKVLTTELVYSTRSKKCQQN